VKQQVRGNVDLQRLPVYSNVWQNKECGKLCKSIDSTENDNFVTVLLRDVLHYHLHQIKCGT
jgi:hypothetical protein